MIEAQERMYRVMEKFIRAKTPKERWSHWNELVAAFDAWEKLR